MNLRWLKQNLIVIVFGIVFAVVLTMIILLERRAATEKADIVAELEKQEAQLTQLRSRDPAPTTENIEAVRRDREQIERLYKELQSGAMRQPVTAPTIVRPIEFSQLMRDTVNRLAQSAAQVPVKTPDNFPFGFVRYDSDFPCRQPSAKAEDCKKVLALLGKQLVVVEKLTGLLIESHVEEINAIRRTEAEPGSSADTLPLAITADPKGLYQVYPFELDFACDTGALRAFLNRLAKSDWFFAVRSIKIDSVTTTTTTGSVAPLVPRFGELERLPETTKTTEHRRLSVTVRVDLIEFASSTVPAKERT